MLSLITEMQTQIKALSKTQTQHIGEFEEAAETWEKEKAKLQSKLDNLKIEVASLRENSHEEGKITRGGKEMLKEEII